MMYHGSSVSGITSLEPKAHGAVGGEKVVFATPDKTFALAMIPDAPIAIDYSGKTIFVDELEPGGFDALSQSGYLYTVSGESFRPDSRLIKQEYISNISIPVLEEECIENILKEIQKNEGIVFVKYDDVPDSIKKREGAQEFQEYDKDRFSSLE
jgi:hypothetical protein